MENPDKVRWADKHEDATGCKSSSKYILFDGSTWFRLLGYCFTPYQRQWLYNGAPLVAFYDTLGIRRTYSRLKPPASSRGYMVHISNKKKLQLPYNWFTTFPPPLQMILNFSICFGTGVDDNQKPHTILYIACPIENLTWYFSTLKTPSCTWQLKMNLKSLHKYSIRCLDLVKWICCEE